MIYRPEIDGLRAIAVIPVILFHAGLIKGGFIGVDVFFVISGYLITNILIEDLAKNQFNLLKFYERRARRLLPALFLVMFLSIPMAYLFMLPSQFKDFSQSLVAVSLFASNILFYKESGYFDTDNDLKPLLHTWSLSVEEQFYLIFPLFLYLSWKLGVIRTLQLLLITAILSVLLCLWTAMIDTNANYYSSITRAWELLSGAITAFIVKQHGTRANNLFASIGLSLIFGSLFFNDNGVQYPSIYTFIPVIGTVLVILYANNDSIVTKFLSLAVFVKIGLISYSAYLWHQPLFAFVRLSTNEDPTYLMSTTVIVLTFVFAYFSWRYVELYFRNAEKIRPKNILIFAAVGLVSFSSLGIFGHFAFRSAGVGTFNPYQKIENHAGVDYIVDNKYLQAESWNILRARSGNLNYKTVNNDFDNKLWYDLNSDKSRLLIVGNSHSKDIYNIVIKNDQLTKYFQTARYGIQLYDLQQTHKFWESPNYLNSTHVVIASRYYEDDIPELSSILKRILQDKKAIYIINSIYEFPGEASGYNLIDEIVLEKSNSIFNNQIEHVAETINSSYYQLYANSENMDVQILNKEISKIAAQLDIQILDRMEYVCDQARKLCYAVTKELQKNFYDYGHHTLSGADFFSNSEAFIKFIFPLLETAKHYSSMTLK